MIVNMSGIPALAAASVVLLGQQPTDPPASLWESGGQWMVGALFAVYVILQILDRVMPLIQAKKGNGSGNGVTRSWLNTSIIAAHRDTLNTMADQISDMHQWHSRVDARGVPVWYHDAETNRRLAQILEQLVGLTQEMARDVRDLRESGPKG